MIVTLTANPCLDRTIETDAALVPGMVQSYARLGSQAAGKGVNISRAAIGAGVPTLAVLPAPAGDAYVTELAAASIPVARVDSPAPIRVNVTITAPDGTTTKLNAAGTALGAPVLDALAARTVEAARDATWVVLAGSLPAKTPSGWYADLLGALRQTPARVAVDTSGAPLRELALRVLGGGAAPDLMKPNAEELAHVVGGDADRLGSDPLAAATAAMTLVEAGVGAVLATLGAHGAVLVTGEGAWLATPPAIRPVSTVGAGDSSLFGYLLADLRGEEPARRLALAVAYGTAAAALPGTTIPRPDQVRPDLVAVERLTHTAPSPTLSSRTGE